MKKDLKNPGLSNKEVELSRKKHGENKIVEHKRRSFFRGFVSNLSDPIIKVLIIALGLNIIFMFPNINWFESGGICASIVISTLVSTISEYSSEGALERLREESQNARAIVRREGKELELLSEEIVVGDIVIISQGDKIVADGELIDGVLFLDESALTGESVEVKKELNVSEKSKELLKGSVVCQGFGEMRVTSVGEKTYYGRVASELSEETRPSPLKHRLTSLAKTISKIGYFFAFLIAFAYLFNSFVIKSSFNSAVILTKVKDLKFLFSQLINALTLAISIVVVAVPEGLPMMITVVLSSNMKKMMRDHVLVRKLVGIETSGNINLLFTDKTGTLTEGELKVKEIYNAECEKASGKNGNDYGKYLTLCGIYCNNATLSKNIAVGSNATDRALLEYFKGAKNDALIVEQIPFNSTSKYSATVVNVNDKEHTLFKGAPEKIINASNTYLDNNGEERELGNRHKSKLLSKLKELALSSFRVVALGMKMGKSDTSLEKISFLGLVAIKDKIRKEVPLAIREVTEAGVGVVMITGDNRDTATAIAKECGIISSLTGRELVIEGNELINMSDDEIAKALPKIAVIARALPSDKSRLVRIAQNSGYIVGMTGDGINDASSLKMADVGFAMGSGTDVAKEACDIVITDNNFASIVKSILYGRTIFESIRKFIVFQLTMNLSAVGISLIGPFIGVDSPVTITQMLWVNIIMDTLGALAFATEPSRRSYMKEKPKPRDEKLLTKNMIGGILINGVYILGLCVWFLKSEGLPMLLTRGDDRYILSAFFATFIFIGIFVCFTSRTKRLNILSQISKNKSFITIMLLISVMQMAFIYFGGDLFRATPLKLEDLVKAILIAFSVVVFDFIRKISYKAFKINNLSKRRKEKCQTNTCQRAR